MPPTRKNTPAQVRDPQPDDNFTPEGATSPGSRESEGSDPSTPAPRTLDVAGDAPEHPEGATTPDTDEPGYSDSHNYDTPWGLRTLHPDQVDQLRRDNPWATIRPVEQRPGGADGSEEPIDPVAEARTSAELATGERIADTPARRAAEFGDRVYASGDLESPGDDTPREG